MKSISLYRYEYECNLITSLGTNVLLILLYMMNVTFKNFCAVSCVPF
uniref:Uncharacterized protein n=1 Tax=Anguilla anguilla TaxID=7936 RepID=A0A0E9TEB3_ANGAN